MTPKLGQSRPFLGIEIADLRNQTPKVGNKMSRYGPPAGTLDEEELLSAALDLIRQAVNFLASHQKLHNLALVVFYYEHPSKEVHAPQNLFLEK